MGQCAPLDNHTAIAYLNYEGGLYVLSMLSSSQCVYTHTHARTHTHNTHIHTHTHTHTGVGPSTGYDNLCRIKVTGVDNVAAY